MCTGDIVAEGDVVEGKVCSWAIGKVANDHGVGLTTRFVLTVTNKKDTTMIRSVTLFALQASTMSRVT